MPKNPPISSPTALDVMVNIAQTKAEESLRRGVDKRLARASAMICAARSLATSMVGLEAAEELLTAEACSVREERQEKAMLRKLRAGV